MASGLIFDDEGRDITMEVLSAAVAEMNETPPINPDCLTGKHQACAGDAWDVLTDSATPCVCPCHTEGRTER